MKDIVHVINLPKRTDRLRQFEIQATEQNFEYQVWDGIIDLAATFRGISNSHKQIVKYAKMKGLKRIVIAEDDCVFTGIGAYDYFLNQIPESYDLFFASYYEGKVDCFNRLVKADKASELLSGLTLYVINERFYYDFLNIYSLDHLDKQIGKLADKYEFYVCPEFCAVQSNGYSDNKKKECNYDHYMKGRKLFGVNSQFPKVH